MSPRRPPRPLAPAPAPSLQRWPDEARPLVTAWERRARERWPGLRFDAGRFAARVVPHLTSQALRSPEQLRVEDLFLVGCCLEGQAGALAELDGRLKRLTDDDELLQVVREKLLLGVAPRLASFAGRGELDGWLRLVVRRLKVDLARAAPRELPVAEVSAAFAQLLVSSPELSLVRRQARPRLAHAAAEAFERLSAADQRLLRRHHLDGIPHGALGEELGVPRATVARWLEQAREKWAKAARRALKDELHLDSAELASLVGILSARIEP